VSDSVQCLLSSVRYSSGIRWYAFRPSDALQNLTTQPCIPLQSLNRVPALLGCRRECLLCPLAGDTMIPYSVWVSVTVRQVANCCVLCFLTYFTYLLPPTAYLALSLLEVLIGSWFVGGSCRLVGVILLKRFFEFHFQLLLHFLHPECRRL